MNFKPWINKNSFNLGPYTFPSTIYTTKFGLIYITSHRNKLLGQGSKWAPRFEKDILEIKNNSNPKYREELDYIKEVPIFILNRGLWNELVEKYNVEKDKKDASYFVLDYFFYNLNIIIEIDSLFHIPTSNYDKARDEYISIMYGMSTYRIYNYGKNPEDINNLITKLSGREKFKQTLGISGYPNIDFSDIIIDNFIYKYQWSINCVDEISKKFYELASSNEYFTPNYISKEIKISSLYFKRLNKNEITCAKSILYWIYGIKIIEVEESSIPYICIKDCGQ